MGFVLFGLALASDLWRAFVLSYVWAEAIVPQFGAPSLNTGMIFLFMMMVACFKGASVNSSYNETENEMFDKTLTRILLNSVYALILLVVVAIAF